MKYLGVLLDDHLTFKEYYVLKNVGKKISFLNRIGNNISALHDAWYKTIVAPNFEYCATIMINMGKTEIKKL